MARSRSVLAPIVAAALAFDMICQIPTAFLPAAPLATRVTNQLVSQEVAGVGAAAVLALAAAPLPAFALASSDDDEGFDFRIVAVLGLPVVAASWALFNVWRVAFRQGVRLNEGLSGSSKIGLNAED
eukprot:CAMPEP_0177468286 /NCGR_PEP_ID=MMETSP0369-20130122/18987_1 /TAXON_ID=447022 ORGANISM="Scrippsiella hangoei-like, Strain SHHI-4" /NCGR_SAMPLE_ID=MMETSP0369 /ASSEMBLY_ACC=CAM_ASM_000364 /LENGTH=126 /DNA_ID=CAMNT_0018942469 /DNA_START=50 /DNA_END=430 /DNA_ORIENTATION=+